MAQSFEDLERALSSTQDAAARIDLLNELALALRYDDSDRAFALLTDAIELAKGLPPSVPRGRVYDTLITLATLQALHARYDEALQTAQVLHDRAASAGDEHTRMLAAALICQTLIYQGSFPRASDLAFRTLDHAERVHDLPVAATMRVMIGRIYLELSDLDNAATFLNYALRIAREENLGEIEAQARDALGATLRRQGQLEEAREESSLALALYRRSAERRGEGEALVSLGATAAAAGEQQAAIKHFTEALAIARRIRDRQVEALGLLGLGRAYLGVPQLPRARTYLEQGLVLSESIGSRYLSSQLHQSLAEAAERAGDPESALRHFRAFFELDRAVYTERVDARIYALATEHELDTAQREAEIHQLRSVALKHEIEEKELAIAELDSFAHTVAHDLKNPLSTIAGFAFLLRESVYETLDAEERVCLDNITRGATKAQNIVNALLLLASVRKRDQIEMTPLDMGRIVRESQIFLEEAIAESGAQISLPAEWPLALGFAPWIEQVWVNYLSNAIKYGGAPPLIHLGADTLSNGSLRFWVHDNGEGLSPEEIARIFTPFTRLSQANIKGHGLGLSIVQRIIERQGGRVGVDSSPGEGSTFWFTLPAAGASLAPPVA